MLMELQSARHVKRDSFARRVPLSNRSVRKGRFARPNLPCPLGWPPVFMLWMTLEVSRQQQGSVKQFARRDFTAVAGTRLRATNHPGSIVRKVRRLQQHAPWDTSAPHRKNKYFATQERTALNQAFDRKLVFRMRPVRYRPLLSWCYCHLHLTCEKPRSSRATASCSTTFHCLRVPTRP